MARHKTWVSILSDLVRDNPRTSAMIAFNLGVWAGQATQKKLGRTDFSELPAKLIDMMPSMKEIGEYVPSLPSPMKVMKRKTIRRGKPAARRPAKRRSSKQSRKAKAAA